MPRRSKMEILLDILVAVSQGKTKPTHIMYQANLSWTRLGGYLDFLGGQGLLKRIEKSEGVRYEITETGIEVLSYFRKLESALYYRKKVLPSEVSVHFR